MTHMQCPNCPIDSNCFCKFLFAQILSMIEEAAGTSLYEKKREQTTAVIEKKDSKLKEMDSVSYGGSGSGRSGNLMREKTCICPFAGFN